MTSAGPSVSAGARRRMMAFRLAMRCTPMESAAVTTAGRPSGTAATDSAAPRMSTSKTARAPRTSPARKIVATTTAPMATTISPGVRPMRSEFLLERRGLLRQRALVLDQPQAGGSRGRKKRGLDWTCRMLGR
jgi:hypothetical protein